MAYKLRSQRRLARKSKKNFITSFIIIIFLLFVTFQWILPAIINGVGFVKEIVKPSEKTGENILEKASLAPPILNISYEATGSSQINISGFGTSGSKVELFLDDEKKDTVDVSEDGSFEFKNISLSPGINNIYAKSLDEKNQESLSSKIFKITFDSEKPSLSLSEPEDNKKIQGGDKKITVSGNTETGAQVFVNENQVIVNKDGNFSSIISLYDGDNDFNIKAVDKAGNTNEVSRRVNYQPQETQ